MMYLAVLRRELRGFLQLPQTYGIAAAYFVVSGIFFVNILVSTQVPALDVYYANVANTILVLAPIVAMRSFAEERRTGALDMELSWPLSRTALVLGKFTANTLFVWAVATITWLYVRVLASLSNVEVGKAAAGYVGLLLLIAAFSALALAVSARTSSPAAAAFLGFGLLLFLWILEFAPGYIGKRLASLAPQSHLEAFRNGVIYLSDVVYFLTIAAIGVGLTIHALNRSRAGRKSAALLRREIGLVAVVSTWVLGSFLANQAHAQFDLTPTKRFTATPATRAITRRVHSPVTMIGFVNPFGPDAARLRSLVKQYQAIGVDMRIRIVDPDVEPAFTKQVGATSYGDFAVEVDGKREILENPNQIDVTSAIMRLSRADRPVVCFTFGHGERDLESPARGGLSSLGRHLERLGLKTQALSLGAPGGPAALGRCAEVVVAGPQVPFTADEFALLQNYAKGNGRLVVMASGAIEDQLNDLVRPWGVTFGGGQVRDRSSLADDPASIVSFDYPSDSPITRGMLVKRIPTVFVNPSPIARTLQSSEEGWLTPLVQSSKQSWTEQDGKKAEGGPFILGAIVDWSRVQGDRLADASIARTRIAVLGSADVASNRFVDLFGNADLVTGLIQFVGRENDVIAAGRDPGGVYKLVLTSAQKADVVRRGIVLPSIAVILPVPLMLWRLRRG